MSQPCRICVFGSTNIDLTFRTPRFPQAGETLTGHCLLQGLGGKGANQAVAAARLGADVTFVSCVGDDAFGLEAINQFQADRINSEFVRRVDGQPTGTAAIIVDDQAENYIIVIPGANASLSQADVRRAARAIEDADAVVCQLETPMNSTLEAFRLARAAGKRTVLTPAPVVDLPEELLSLCDVCVPNRTEIQVLVGNSVTNLDEAHFAVKQLMRRGVGSVALTMGSQGAFVMDASGAFHIPAAKVQAKDTTGAGDAFSAALAVFLGEGFSLHESAKRASIVGALTVTRLGTHAAFPSREELEANTSLKVESTPVI